MVRNYRRGDKTQKEPLEPEPSLSQPIVAFMGRLEQRRVPQKFLGCLVFGVLGVWGVWVFGCLGGWAHAGVCKRGGEKETRYCGLSVPSS